MLVRDGYTPTGHDLTGGRYDPARNTWMPISTANAPAGRSRAVWTGTEMMVWGGANAVGSLVQSGGRYDPARDTWKAISTINAPSPRSGHASVWGGGNPEVDTGGRYDPIADAWKPVTTTGAPSPRTYHSAVWTGSRLVIWGGSDYDRTTFIRTFLDTGAAYDPGTNTWSPVATTGAPAGRHQHAAVWTASRMLIWGGAAANYLGSGGAYDPVAGRWTTMSVSGEPTARSEHSAVWTGKEMIVWGGQGGTGLLNTGGRYVPSADSWTALPTANAPAPRWHHAAVWTGEEMIVWGGWVPEPGDTPQVLFNDGGRYDPAANTWSPTSVIGAPGGRRRPSAVWTGSPMIVLGG